MDTYSTTAPKAYHVQHNLGLVASPELLLTEEEVLRRLKERTADGTLQNRSCDIILENGAAGKSLLIKDTETQVIFESFSANRIYNTQHLEEGNQLIIFLRTEVLSEDKVPTASLEAHVFRCLEIRSSQLSAEIDRFYMKPSSQRQSYDNSANAYSYLPSGMDRNMVSTHSYYDEEKELFLTDKALFDVQTFFHELETVARSYDLMRSSNMYGNSILETRRLSAGQSVLMKIHMPTDDEFIQHFRKIKFSLNMLARIHIYGQTDKHSIEKRLHNLMNILEVSVDSSRNSANGRPEVAASVEYPMLSELCVGYLNQHLNSNEKTMWYELGPNWTEPRELQNKFLPIYTPLFKDGYIPLIKDYDPFIFTHKVESINNTI